jgi:hypothetical protein
VTALDDPEDSPPNERPTRPFGSVPPKEADTERPPPPEGVEGKLDWVIRTLADLADGVSAIRQNQLVLKAEVDVIRDDCKPLPEMSRRLVRVEELAVRTDQRVGELHERMIEESDRTGRSVLELQRAEARRGKTASASPDDPDS